VNNRTNLPWGTGEQPNIQQLLQTASQDSQLWYDILEAANQSLELTKCCYHVIEFEFKSSGKPTMVNHNQACQLEVKDKQNNRVTIRHVPNNEATKYLGCWKAPNGQKQQRAALAKKCDEYARIINCSILTRRETKYFYEGIYKPSVGYPLPTTYFTEKELEKIQAKSHQAMITHCGYNRYTARSVIYGLKRLGGAAFTHLYDMQGYGQLEMFIKSWRAKQTHQGRILRIALQWAQYCAGTSKAILEDTKMKIPYLESEWIKSLRTYLGAINGSLLLDQTGLPPLMRENDQYLMEIATNMGKFKPHQLQRINYCRLYMNVTTVSEITNAKGDMLDPAMLNGDRATTMSSDRWQRVNQQRPDRVSWNLWNQVCKSISSKVNNKWYLKQQLGKWTIPQEQRRRHWTFWYDQQTDRLYQFTEDRITQHHRMWYDFDEDGTMIDALPESAIPVDVERRDHAWRLKQYTPRQPATGTTTEEDVNTISQRIQQLQQWEKELLEGVHMQLQDNTMKHEFTRPLKIASDGSVQGHRASYAWIIANEEGMRLATCKGPAYGCKPTSYRAEGYGILSALRFLLLLERIWGTRSQCQLACDNEAAVKQCRQKYDPTKVQPNQTLIEEWDVMVEIWTTMKHLNTTVSIQHIKGHADTKQP
jgi:hypothetical protein